MKLAFYLSGEHEKLPESEVLAVMDACDLRIEDLERSGRLFILNLPRVDPSELRYALNRLAMTREVVLVLYDGKPDDSSLRKLADQVMISRDESFAVRISNLGEGAMSSRDLEARLGGLIKEKTGAKVNLENPDVVIRGYLMGERLLIGRIIHRISTKQFSLRDPRRRPFFHPTALKPKLARVLVNLSRVRHGSILLDPFCGSGSILIEAGLVGARPLGLDLDHDMLKGCRENLAWAKIRAHLIRGDARKMPLSAIDHVASDLPYGRSSRTYGNIIENFRRFLEELRSLLRGYASICVSHIYPIEDVIDHGFELLEKHELYVHKSLRRIILVLR